MELIKQGNVFVFIGGYNDRLIPKNAGFRWDATEKHWFTDSLEKAKTLYEYANDECLELFDDDDNLKESSYDLSYGLTCEEDYKRPKELNYFDFQKVAIKYALNRNNVLIADEMGTGKSIEALGILNNTTFNTALIVCSATLKYNWLKEAEKWLVEKKDIIVLDSKSTFDYQPDTIYIVNYDIINKFDLCLYEWDFLILDEAHKIKSKDAKRSKAVKELVARKKIFLTGTPILNKPIELHNIIKQLGCNIKFWDYVEKYCDPTETPFGWDLSGVGDLDDLNEYLRSTVMIRRLKKDTLPQLPEKTHQTIEVKNIKYLKQESEIFNNQDFEVVFKNLNDFQKNYFEQISAMRLLAGQAKIKPTIELLEDYFEESDEKIVVFAHHHEVLSAIYEKFSDRAVILTGKTPPKKRQEIVEQFQTDENIKLFVGSIQAAGEGITLTASSHVVFAELDWVYANMNQAIDRTHRIGAKNNILIQYVVIQDSLDALLAKKIITKQKILQSLN